jgi:hypothetical protein
MCAFGKRPNSTDIAFILQSDRAPAPCRVVERTLRVVRVSVADLNSVKRHFTLVLNNGEDKVFCSIISVGEDCLVARYSSHCSSENLGLASMDAALTAERWKGS